MVRRAAAPIPLIINRAAGLGRARRVESRLTRCFSAMGVEVRVVPTDSRAHAAKAAAALLQECDRILVAGGDGTVSSVLPSLLGRDAALGILPVGMSNGVARELCIPRSIEGMCRVAAGERVRTIDVGCANGRPFILMAGVGFDAQVVRAVKPGLKRAIGPAAYVMAALALARAGRGARLEVAHDGSRIQLPVWLAVAANGSTYTYHWKAVPDASMSDGLLDLCLFRCCGPMQTLGQVAAAVRGTHLRHPEVLCIRAPALTLTANPPLPVQVDGDEAGTTPLALAVMPQALKVLVP